MIIYRSRKLGIVICMTHRIPDSQNKESGYKANEQNHGGAKCRAFALLWQQTWLLMIRTPPKELQICLVVLFHASLYFLITVFFSSRSFWSSIYSQLCFFNLKTTIIVDGVGSWILDGVFSHQKLYFFVFELCVREIYGAVRNEEERNHGCIVNVLPQIVKAAIYNL